MDQNIINQCRAAGGKIINDKCEFNNQRKSKFNLELKIGRFDLKKAALWTFISSITFAAILGIFALMGKFGETQFKILISTGISGMYGLLMIAVYAVFAKRSKLILYLTSICFTLSMLLSELHVWGIEPFDYIKSSATISILFGFGLIAIANNAIRNKFSWLTYIGWGCNLIAFLAVMNQLWNWKLFYEGDTFNYLKIMIDLIILSILSGHMSLMLLINSTKQSVKTLQWITIGIAVLTALIIMGMVHMEPEEWIYQLRILGIVGILNVAATIITPVFNKLKG